MPTEAAEQPCPSLIQVARAAFTLGTPEDAHIGECRACQHRVALAWRAQCPDHVLLARVLARGGRVGALREHVDEDVCPRCRALLRSPWLLNVAQELRDGRRKDLPLSTVAEETVSMTPGTPFTSLWAAVRRTDRGYAVEVSVSTDAADAGDSAYVEVLGGDTPVTARLRLTPDGTGSHVVGRMELAAAPAIHPDEALVAVVSVVNTHAIAARGRHHNGRGRATHGVNGHQPD